VKSEKKLANLYRRATVRVNMRCNLHCPLCICRTWQPEPPGYEMTQEQFARVVSRLHDLNWQLRSLMLTGGEACLWPHLPWAIAEARQVADEVWVHTNAVRGDAADFEGADKLIITSYGAINRIGIHQLRKTFPGRIEITNPVHIPWPPADNTEGTIPAVCSGVSLQFTGDLVRPCCFGEQAASVESDFLTTFMESNPWTQPGCRRCLANRSMRQQHCPPPTIEVAVWDSSIAKYISLRNHHAALKPMVALFRRNLNRSREMAISLRYALRHAWSQLQEGLVFLLKRKWLLPVPAVILLVVFLTHSLRSTVASPAAENVVACLQAVHSQPDDAEAHFALGRAYYEAADLSHAAESFARAIQIDPNHSQADGWLRRCYQDQ
jgi:hypothetical protein